MKIETIQVGKTYVNKKGQKRTVEFLGPAPRFGTQTLCYWRDKTKEASPNVTNVEAFAAWAKTEQK